MLINRTFVRRLLNPRNTRHLSAYHAPAHPLRRPTPFEVSSDPAPVKQFLQKFNVHDIPNDTALQIFTHKSYRHGIEGYNAKLSFLGRRVLYLHLAETLISRPTSSPTAIAGKDIDAISSARLEEILSLERIGDLAMEMGVTPLLRWKPAWANKLKESGEQKVAAESLMAVVGAVEMLYGGRASQEVCQKVIFPKLHLYE